MKKPKKPELFPDTCGNCRFIRFGSSLEVGFCQRFPPLLSDADGEMAFTFPVVTDDEWCGEYQRKLNA